MPLTTLRPSLLTALLCLAVAACGSDSPAVANGGDECDGAPAGIGGEFEATLSGGSTLELCGFASSSEGPGGEGWSILLVTPGGGSSILFATEETGRPIADAYDVVDYLATDASPGAEDYIVLVAFDDDVLGTTGYSSVAGTLTILSSSAGEVSGSFDFSARPNVEAGEVINVVGTFTANNEDV